ncbi:outer membrane lipoprotein-sorting protein [Pseudomonas sp. WN033]|nr:outer membrane lipoprotein-sorting protein [Pseudomonas sp. WN033]
MKLFLSSLLVSTLYASQVFAQSAEDLGRTYTPMGGEKAGNAAETIPAWNGGLSRQAGEVDANGRMTNPYAHQHPLFTITASNYKEHEANLSPGQVALFQRYPESFRMPVYATERSAAIPENVEAAIKRNVSQARLSDSGYGLAAFEEAVPFPFPDQGVQIILNHVSRYRGGSIERHFIQVTPQANGAFTPVQFVDQMATRESLTDYDPASPGRMLYFLKQQVKAPARLAGTALLAHEPMDVSQNPRQAWVYAAGQRRVRLAPQVAYDGPGTAADGLRTADNYDLYNGAPDRYDWKIIGKKELYIPYNSYGVQSADLAYQDIVKPGHLNPEHTRYELHRVWHVEATLRDGMRHIYARRVFFIDEDTWQVAVVDHYDGRDGLWRVGEGHAVQYYHVQVPWYAVETLYDLVSGRYIALGLNNQESRSHRFGVQLHSADFTPNALRQAGVR